MPRPHSPRTLDLHGRTMIVTGASSGIGAVTARTLIAWGAEVAVVGRNPERTRAVAEQIGGTPFVADFDRLDDVRKLAGQLLERYPQIHVLMNNAGGLVSERALTVDGYERTFQSNHLAPFLLTRLLLPRLIATAAALQGPGEPVAFHPPVRIISTASVAHRFGQLRPDDLDWAKRRWFGGWSAYGTSKLATILFMRELAARTAGTGVGAYSVHPGFVATSFGDDSRLMKLSNALPGGGPARTSESGAVPLIRLAAAPTIDSPTGTYFDRLRPSRRTSRQARDGGLARWMWEESVRRTGVTS